MQIFKDGYKKMQHFLVSCLQDHLISNFVSFLFRRRIDFVMIKEYRANTFFEDKGARVVLF